ncbi:hypothetical protein RKE38_03030 [Phycicoccus sp. M110.8]|uniref:LysM peptidoglycan-binding domain-containing protein n=1 Tax=Phycicoccus sp. M110.8 TaxID=3075433 RepID=UPI0028FD2B01|nr:hypothetical protein [Phycicoccus sp. M110.8]MDU0312644.1 hypothetical protein [Phycicoccus sp. M110.8]
MAGRTTRRGRIAALATGALVAGSALETALVASAERQWEAVLAAGPARPDEVVGAVLATAAVLLGAWLAVTTLTSLLAHLPGRVGRLLDAWSRSWSPAAVRRVAAVLVGASVSGVLAPGSAVGAAPPSPSPGFTVTAPATRPTAAPDQGGAADRAALPGFTVTGTRSARPESPAAAPGWVPQRPVVRPQAAPGLVAGTPRRTSGAEVVVLRGDSLWSIVAHRLGPEATDAEVAGEWPRWYAANRSVIGDDPGVLLPGQVLHAPRAEAVAR